MLSNKSDVRPIRRKDRVLSEQQARKILQTAEFGILSTVSPNNQPYGTPVHYVVIGNAIYFHSASRGHKLDNIDSNNQVCFCVVGKNQVIPEQFTTNYASVVVFGHAGRVEDREKKAALEALVDKFSPQFTVEGAAVIEKEFKRTVVIKIEIDHITGKARNE